jgi:hypothetical protein
VFSRINPRFLVLDHIDPYRAFGRDDGQDAADHWLLSPYRHSLGVVWPSIVSTVHNSSEPIRRHQALPNQEDISQLKALIAWEALVHPDHPLRTPGQKGLEIFRGMYTLFLLFYASNRSFVGIFENGEARLLFSSAQIEYIRYYLHAMKLTAEPIPLPSSKYLIKRGDLKSCVPDYYDSAPMLKKSMKVIFNASFPYTTALTHKKPLRQ